MPKDPRRRQEKLLKKRRKEKAKKKRIHASGTSSPERALLRNARKFPICECFINSDWEEQKLADIVVTRSETEHLVMFGVYLVDLGCLGVKNAFWRGRVTHSDYAQFKEDFREGHESISPCSSSLAHQIIYGALDYAKAIGFKPHRDFADAQLILEPRESVSFDAQVEFGLDGAPFYASGPHDNVARIMNHLERTLGRGNFKFMVHEPIGDFEYDVDDDLGRTTD